MSGFTLFGGFTFGFGGVASMRRNTSSGLGVGSAMSLPPFEGPRQKIKRGWKHLAELKALVSDYSSRAQVRYRLDHEATAASQFYSAFVLEFSEQPSLEMALLIGDAAHNFRAALDMMIGDLVKLRDVKVKHARYPFGPDDEQVRNTIERNLKNIGDDVRDAILDTKPFKGGNNALRGLHDLDVADKHELLTPVFAAAVMQTAFLSGTSWINDGAYIQVPKGIWPHQVVRIIDPKPVARFGITSPFPERPVIEVLDDLGKTADEIVSLFADKFGGGNLVAHSAPRRLLSEADELFPDGSLMIWVTNFPPR